MLPILESDGLQCLHAPPLTDCLLTTRGGASGTAMTLLIPSHREFFAYLSTLTCTLSDRLVWLLAARPASKRDDKQETV